jgi:serine/threonine protein kinase
MEYMGGGSLTEILEQYKYVQLTEPEIAFICFEVSLSLFLSFSNYSYPHSFTAHSLFFLLLSPCSSRFDDDDDDEHNLICDITLLFLWIVC